MAPRLLQQLRLQSNLARITTLGRDSWLMMAAKDSRKITIACPYFEHLAPVEEPDVLVVPMTAYNLVLALPWFQSRNAEIDWSKRQLLGLQIPVGNSGNEQTITSLPQGDGCVGDGASKPPPAVDIQFLEATTFDELIASNEAAVPFVIRIDEGTGLLGATTFWDSVNLEKLGQTCPGQP
jgi:hypothetical protein